MDKMRVNTKEAYDIYFSDSFDGLAEAFEDLGYKAKKVCIVTDWNVGGLYAETVKNILQVAGHVVEIFSFKPGENSKNLDTIQEMYKFFIEKKLDRKSVVLALGGGVTGDMAGFAASTYMRGIEYVQAPTTLLAQADSSVGGKTGVDFCGNKNLVGSFYQPVCVYMNINALSSLPTREFSAGMGEVIKHGLILDREFVGFLRDNARSIMNLDYETLKSMVKHNCYLKETVVAEDTKEKGRREILNFGHTFGHSIETLLDFAYLHGECVGFGMVCASYLSMMRGCISPDDFNLVKELLQLFGLSNTIKVLGVDGEKVYEQMLYDKKVKAGKLSFLLLSGIGECYATSDVTKEEILQVITACQQDTAHQIYS